MKFTLAAACCAAAATAEVYHKETFDSTWEDRWVSSTAKEGMGTFTRSAGEWSGDAEEDAGLYTSEAMRFYAAGTKLAAPATTKGKDLVLQFSVKHEKREYSFCGGGYLKLMDAGADLAAFDGDTPYSVMFGPDMCGYDVSRIHAILNHEGENLLKTEDVKLDYSDKNEFTHLYTLVLKADKTYAVYFDQVEKASGNIGEDWGFPPKEIDDPTDSKPESWVDEVMIPDVEDVKPDGYDDVPEEIPDPDAVKPEDWDDEDDGEWEAPTIDNPEFKGVWEQSMIENPEYKGEWSPAQIANEAYTVDIANYDNLGTAGFELWIVNEGSVFDNIFVGDSYDEAKAFADETWGKTVEAEKVAKEAFDAAKKAVDDAAAEEAAAAAAAAAPEEEEEEAAEEEEETHDEL